MALILKRHPEAEGSERYLVYFEGRCVGSIFDRPAGTGARDDASWFWGLEFHEWQGCKGPQYGGAANREAAMAAFKATWESKHPPL